MKSAWIQDRASLQMRIRVLEQRDPDGQALNKLRNLETLLEQRKQSQEELEARIAALEDPRDLDQIMEDVRARLADEIA
jgi:hypothetical protein